MVVVLLIFDVDAVMVVFSRSGHETLHKFTSKVCFPRIGCVVEKIRVSIVSVKNRRLSPELLGPPYRRSRGDFDSLNLVKATVVVKTSQEATARAAR